MLQSFEFTVTKELILQHGIHAVDFKGEAITFKATTAGILATMAHCIEIMNQREEQWKRKLEREQVARKRLEEKLKSRVSLNLSFHHNNILSKILYAYLTPVSLRLIDFFLL